ncbi:DUF5711 family protein [Marinisporobacter balticus]|uniref:Pyrroloquinoline-quinone binding quinoprotein n=1 Tax=Marinisporobacter balticus TaxID=2018667 RepID=A0A4R2L293_9FIRM|nr:DUF5711 family protein [Marinisporobacter balticus]TCO77999.1 hypothetical protein EV214_10598 [Marinisporobacter balticus]
MTRKRRQIRFKIMVLILIFMLILGGVKLIKTAKSLLGYGALDFQTIVTIDYENEKNLIVLPFKEDMIIYNENKLKRVTLAGEEKWKKEKVAKDPIMRTGGNLIFLANKETGQITAYDDGGNIVWEVDLKKSIGDFVCNKEGIIALYYENEENSEIHIFNMEGKEAGKIRVDQGTIIDINISDEEGNVAISVMGIEKNKIETNVALYAKEGKLLGGNTYTNQIISNVFFSDNNQIMCVGDKKLMVFSKEDALLGSIDIPGDVNRVAWNQQGFIAMHLIDNRRTIIDTKNRNYIWIVEMEGKEESKIPIQGEVLGMDSKGENVVAFTDRTLYFIFKKGKQLMEKKIHNDIQSVYMFSDNKLILVLKNKIEIMQVKNKSKD